MAQLVVAKANGKETKQLEEKVVLIVDNLKRIQNEHMIVFVFLLCLANVCSIIGRQIGGIT